MGQALDVQRACSAVLFHRTSNFSHPTNGRRDLCLIQCGFRANSPPVPLEQKVSLLCAGFAILGMDPPCRGSDLSGSFHSHLFPIPLRAGGLAGELFLICINTLFLKSLFHSLAVSLRISFRTAPWRAAGADSSMTKAGG